jgi:hypothetical protein
MNYEPNSEIAASILKKHFFQYLLDAIRAGEGENNSSRS